VATFEEKVAGLVERAGENSRWRQRDCVNLIPSENTPSLLVKMLEITDPAGRYAEHRNLKGEEIYFYQGIDFIERVEEECRDEMKAYFGAHDVELRPISGQMANIIVFESIVRSLNKGRPKGVPVRRMKTVMNNALIAGGHLSSQYMGALFNAVEAHPETGKPSVVNLPCLEDNPYRCDVERAVALLEETRPDLVIFGKSMFLFPEPVAEMRAAADNLDPPPVIMFDMAHVLGLYGAFQAPLAEGADVVTGSTHKTFFGTQRGVVAGNIGPDHPRKGLWGDMVARAFPGNTSNHHLGSLTGLLLAAIEMNAFKAEYQAAVRNNAKAFAKALAAEGVPVEGEADGYTQTHQVLFRVPEKGTADKVARFLEEQGIVTNYQALPDDESFTASTGIRTGVQEMTRFGMDEADFADLAKLVARALKGEKIAGEVREFRSRFTTMRYCLPYEKAVPLAAGILDSAMPRAGFTGALREALGEA